MTLFGQISNNRFVRPLLNIAERLAGSTEMLRRNNDALSERIRVAMPAKVISFDASKCTIVAQPMIQEKVIDRDTGDVFWVAIPPIQDIPVHFPQAGNFVMTMPVQAGDEVLLIFNDSCIDSWWESGNLSNWVDRRRHDLSDAMAIPGINSVPNVIPNIATDAAELRQKNGTGKVRIGTGSIVFGGLPVPFDDIKIQANTSSIELNKTIKIVVIDGVPTPVLMDTVNISSTRVLINGVDF